MLALRHGGGPDLGDDHAVDPGGDGLRGGVDVIELVQQPHRLTGAHGCAAFEQGLVMTGKRRDGETGWVHHGHALLGAVAVRTGRLDLAEQEAVVNRRREHALGIDRAATAELRADGDHAQALGLRGQQARRLV